MARKRSELNEYFIWFNSAPVRIRGYSPEAAIGWYFKRLCNYGEITDEQRSVGAHACVKMYHEQLLPVTFRTPVAKQMVGLEKEQLAAVIARNISQGNKHPEDLRQHYEDMMERPIGYLMTHHTLPVFKRSVMFDNIPDLTVSSQE
ncbi:hypothetical protein CL614_01000 [archaeon]|nr:hypothetical protein [archaeon]|tara:strand:- start:356 stop:793 length:438 start_codon:yes stop_codon:yes gene_type:complete